MHATMKAFFSYLETRSNRGVKPGLARITEALRLLGSPQKSFKIIHVAGANGKGSVCSLTAQLTG